MTSTDGPWKMPSRTSWTMTKGCWTGWVTCRFAVDQVRALLCPIGDPRPGVPVAFSSRVRPSSLSVPGADRGWSSHFRLQGPVRADLESGWPSFVFGYTKFGKYVFNYTRFRWSWRFSATKIPSRSGRVRSSPDPLVDRFPIPSRGQGVGHLLQIGDTRDERTRKSRHRRAERVDAKASRN